MAPDVNKKPFRSFLFSACALSLCAFTWCAVLTFDPGDWPSPHQFPNHSPSVNACGVVGAWVSYQFRYWIGDGSYPLLLVLTAGAVLRLIRGFLGNRWEQVCGLVLLVACTSATSHLVSSLGYGSLPVGNGGVVGNALGELLHRNLDRLGTIIVLSAGLFVGITFATDGWALKIPSFVRRLVRANGSVVAVLRHAFRQSVPSSDGLSSAERAALAIETGTASTTSRAGRRSKKRDDAESQTVLFDDEESDEELSECEGEEDVAEDAAACEDAETDDETADPRTVSSKKKRLKPRKQPIVNFPSPDEEVNADPYPRQIEDWRLPALDLLAEPEFGFDKQQEQIVRAQAKVLEQTLEDFRIDARVVEIDTGPVITMFELKLGAGIKVSQIATLSNDIARALKASAIRVVAPISGKNTVGIEVPNIEKERVRLRELMVSGGRRAQEMQLPLFLGKDAGGSALVADLTKMPHLLLAGTTGSGKSVSLNSIILSILMTQQPDHVKLILIDPKMVELNHFKDVPHLMCPIVSDMSRAEKILEWAVTKMDERYSLLAEARVRNIGSYNELGADKLYERLGATTEQEQSRITKRLPYIVIVIDELADLMMTAAREVEHHLARLAQKSRAVGVHIIVATQRPEAKVVTGLIKSNLPSRICFRVASRMDSRIVLDRNGGEVLLGQGDMLFLLPGSHRLIRSQGTYLDDSEMDAVLADLASRSEPEFHPELLRIRAPQKDGDPQMRDPLFDRAVQIVVDSKRGSASLLQRRLTIGYSRASRLVEQMGEAGIVGDYKGSQAREVLLTGEEWKDLQSQLAEDLESDYEADREDPCEDEDEAEIEDTWDEDSKQEHGAEKRDSTDYRVESMSE